MFRRREGERGVYVYIVSHCLLEVGSLAGQSSCQSRAIAKIYTPSTVAS